MKYLVPVARVNAGGLRSGWRRSSSQHHCDTRQAGQLYAAWREGSRAVRERILAEPELFLKTQRQPPASQAGGGRTVERDLEMVVAILRRAGRRLAAALPEMDGPHQEQAQRQIESARRELDRMAARIGKEQEAPHVEPSATNHDSGTECAASEQTRDRTRAATVAPERAQSSALELHQVPEIQRPEKAEPYRQQILELLDHVQGESRASP